MNPEEIKNFLNLGTMTAKVSTASLDSTPHVAPVWFVVDYDPRSSSGDKDFTIIFTTSYDSVKARHLTSNPKICLCVDDQKPPFSFIIFNGIAEIDQHPNYDELLRLTSRIAERYMGKENAEKYGKRNAVKGECIIKIKPRKIIAQKNVSE
jgi:PPOX class probable F420-dependent enzyme